VCLWSWLICCAYAVVGLKLLVDCLAFLAVEQVRYTTLIGGNLGQRDLWCWVILLCWHRQSGAYAVYKWNETTKNVCGISRLWTEFWSHCRFAVLQISTEECQYSAPCFILPKGTKMEPLSKCSFKITYDPSVHSRLPGCLWTYMWFML
jgi:hypothetical protein